MRPPSASGTCYPEADRPWTAWALPESRAALRAAAFALLRVRGRAGASPPPCLGPARPTGRLGAPLALAAARARAADSIRGLRSLWACDLATGLRWAAAPCSAGPPAPPRRLSTRRRRHGPAVAPRRRPDRGHPTRRPLSAARSLPPLAVPGRPASVHAHCPDHFLRSVSPLTSASSGVFAPRPLRPSKRPQHKQPAACRNRGEMTTYHPVRAFPGWRRGRLARGTQGTCSPRRDRDAPLLVRAAAPRTSQG